MPVEDCPRGEPSFPSIAHPHNDKLLFTLGGGQGKAGQSRVGDCIAHRLVHRHVQWQGGIEVSVNDFVLFDAQLTGPYINGT